MMSTRSVTLAAALGVSLAALGCKKAAPEGSETPPAAEQAASPEAQAAPAQVQGDAPSVAVAAAAAAAEEAGSEGAKNTPPELAAALEQAAKDDTLVAVGASGKTRVVAAGQKTLADTDTYSIRVEVPDAASAGKGSQVTVHVSPKPGWKLNKDFPTKLTVTPPAGVSVAKPTQSVKDAAKFEDQAAAFEIDFTPSSAGAKQFTADFRFAVCTESTCDPKKQALAWNVAVE